MSDALNKYKALVDKLRDLSSSSDSIEAIDIQLKETWAALGETEKAEAESYFRGASSHKILVNELN
jgi:hypothetical protein